MNYEQFVDELADAGLSVKAFAGLVGMKPNSITNYARKEVPSHLAMIAVLIAEMSNQRVDFRKALEKVDPVAKKPRGGAQPGRFGSDRQVSMDLTS
ncbi:MULTISPECIES: XRE family transcriptional regulator [unclassified Novosphingobium]|uniref:XRE family transcriptional regulator n=1 Tax=unclassified Novosphingobium TaxID=2644732 RepID=UPI0025FB7F0D|nr:MULTISPECIES: XRE family transcriptional regulator [unclassified Novosphingobium]HQV01866.1 XRE family transcriptional regulator [Novosphingobium sp.]